MEEKLGYLKAGAVLWSVSVTTGWLYLIYALLMAPEIAGYRVDRRLYATAFIVSAAGLLVYLYRSRFSIQTFYDRLWWLPVALIIAVAFVLAFVRGGFNGVIGFVCMVIASPVLAMLPTGLTVALGWVLPPPFPPSSGEPAPADREEVW